MVGVYQTLEAIVECWLKLCRAEQGTILLFSTAAHESPQAVVRNLDKCSELMRFGSTGPTNRSKLGLRCKYCSSANESQDEFPLRKGQPVAPMQTVELGILGARMVGSVYVNL
jgi:hypothetical protein